MAYMTKTITINIIYPEDVDCEDLMPLDNCPCLVPAGPDILCGMSNLGYALDGFRTASVYLDSRMGLNGLTDTARLKPAWDGRLTGGLDFFSGKKLTHAAPSCGLARGHLTARHVAFCLTHPDNLPNRHL